MLLLQVIAALDPVNGDLFERIFEEHSGRAYKIAYSYVDHKEDAKDIAQDTFLKIEEGAVRSRVYRAKAKLRERMGGGTDE